MNQSVNRKVHVVIVGGGITGLSAAFHLKQKAERQHLELECTVIERDHRFGGKIQTHREGGFVMEGGPDSMLARKPAGVQLIRELGVESEIIGTNPRAHNTYILHNGKLERLPPGTNMGIPMDLKSFMQTRLLSTAGKLRALSDLVLPKNTHTCDESLGGFLRRRLGDELVENLSEPLLAGIYAGRIDDLSLQATFPQFQMMEQTDRSLILGSRRSRRNAPKSVSSTGRSVFITLRGGLETLPERLIQCLQDFANLQLNTSVNAISRKEDGTYQLLTEREGHTATILADAIILTTPAPATSNLLSNLIPSASLLRDIAYVSTATVIVGYPKSQVEVDLDASGFVIPRREHRAITASTWVSTKWPHTTRDDHVMIRCYVGRAGQEEGLRQSDGDMVKLVQTELKDILGLTATPVFSKVTRWENAMPQYYVNHLDKVVKVEEELAANAPGLFIAGAAYRGVGIPDCIVQGQRAAEAALQHTSSK